MVLHRRLTAGAGIVLTILFLAAPTPAQTVRTPGVVAQEPQPDIAVWLKSRDPRHQAWGAWYVGAGRLRHFAPLVEELVREHLRVSSAPSATLDIALDALIQLQATLDPELLPDLYAIRPAQTLIAASFVEENENFLRHIVRAEAGLHWFAAANLLLARNSRALAPEVLASLRLKVKLHIVDDDRMMGGGSVGGVGVGCGGGGVAPGMPPWATYTLTPFPHSGATVLATGPTSIYYRRVVAAAGHAPAPSVTTISGPTGDDRLKYIAAIAGLQPENLSLRGLEHRTLVLREGSTLDLKLARIRRDLAQRYQRLLAMLIERKVLPPDVQTTRAPEIDFEIEDHRSPGSPKEQPSASSAPL
jgi:hypothetical protein